MAKAVWPRSPPLLPQYHKQRSQEHCLWFLRTRRKHGYGAGRDGVRRRGTEEGLRHVAWCAPRHIKLHLINKTRCTTYGKDESGPPVSVEGYLQSLDPVVQHWRIGLRGRCWVSSRLWREGTHAFRKQHEIAHTNNTKTHSLWAYAAD